MPHSANVQFHSHRKRTSLTQEDIAHLLGFSASSSVSRFERSVRRPDLSVAFAFERILGVAASTLFAPLFEEIACTITARANERLQQLSPVATDPRHAARLAYLGTLAQTSRSLFDA